MTTPILEATTEGAVDFREWKTWYRVTGDLQSGVAPLIAAHGGPGGTHDYLLTMADISRSGRPVIHYDQLGNGRSTHLRDRQLPRFLAHVHPVRRVPERAVLLVSGISLVLGVSFVGQVGLLSSLVNFGALFSFLMLHVSVVVYFLVKKRTGSLLLHLLSPALGFAVIAFVLVSSDIHAKVGGSVWLAIGVVIAIGLRVTGRSPELRLE